MREELHSIRYPAFSQTNKVESLLNLESQEIAKNSKKELQETKLNLESNNPTNTDYLYSLAESGQWKTMMDYKGYKLPGTSDDYATCGTVRYNLCPIDNYAKRFKHNCHRLSCPTCVRKAGQRIATKIQRRIWLYSLMVKEQSHSRKNPLPSHVIESIPADSKFWNYSKQKQNRIFNEMRKIAGITAGSEITHLWRFRKGKTKAYLGIHNHLIAFGWINGNASKEIKEKFDIDVVYHKVDHGTLKKREDVFLVAYYLLSHCAVKNNKHSLRWFGELSYRKISNSYLKQFRDEQFIDEDNEIEKSKSCKICDGRLLPAKINKKFSNWASFMPPPEDIDEGCEVVNGLFLIIDFFEEKMVFYENNHDEVYHKTRRELDKERQERNPLIYCRNTDSQKLDIFQ